MTRSVWRQRITLLAIPSSALGRPWKACLSVRTLALAAAGWAAATALAIMLGLRLADYGWLRADNLSLHARLAELSGEMSRSRAELEAAREADQKVRALLRLPAAPAEPAPAPQSAAAESSGSGGPVPADRPPLLLSYLRSAPPPAPEALRRDLDAIRRLSRQRVESYQQIAAHLAWQKRLALARPAGWPAPGRVTSRYGRRFSPLGGDDESGDREFHPGMDIAAPLGTFIRATADGTVVRARWSGGYGRLVMLRHDLGYATLYGHASRILVKEGQRVSRGQAVAAMGSSGRSTGSHVHYEVWFRGRTVNPARFLGARAP